CSRNVTSIRKSVFTGPAVGSTTELSTGYTWGALPGSIQNYSLYDDSNNYNQRFTVSYVTGSHAFKSGLQTLQGHYDFTGLDKGVSQLNFQFRNGAPVSLSEWAGPFLSRMR